MEDSTRIRHLAKAGEALELEPREAGQTGIEEEAAVMEGMAASDSVCKRPRNPSWQSKSTAQHHRARLDRCRGDAGDTTIRRWVNENLEDLGYRPDAVMHIQRRNHSWDEDIPWTVQSSGTAWMAGRRGTPVDNGWPRPLSNEIGSGVGVPRSPPPPLANPLSLPCECPWHSRGPARGNASG
eukprot:5949825-Pleurochrysis_carterae.AAC.1